MKKALAEHDVILEEEVRRFSGRLLKHTGDGCMAVFTGREALACALSIQSRIQGTDWSEIGGLAVRIGIDSGEAREDRGDYFGPVVNRAARIMSAGWGGQILLGNRAAAEVSIPSGASLNDIGVHSLKGLLVPQQLFSASHPDIQNCFPPPRTLSAHPGNLPLQTTEFVGRKKELRQLGEYLKKPETRLLTILGAGGLGKTRTAIQAASENVSFFRHGTWFISLEGADGIGSILSAVAEGLSLVFHGSRTEMRQLADFLADRELLLILDNFEHLQQWADIVSRILSFGPGVKILVTSRHRLGIREETVFDLPGLASEGSDACELFTLAAARVYPGFTPGKNDLAAVSESCRLLEGHPLAIELTASWVRTISCSEILDELKKSVDLLDCEHTDRPGRHNSMKSVFLYSWELLEDDEKSALAGLSCFDGGFSRKAAGEVAGCSLRVLRNLCDRSLVSRTGDDRYTLHRITSTFSSEYQSLIPDLAEKHTGYYKDLLDELKPRLTSDEQGQILDHISLEYRNIRRAALHVYKSLNFELMYLFSSTLSVYLQLRSQYTEGLEFFSELLAIAEKADCSGNICKVKIIDTRARLLERLGSFMIMSGKYSEASDLLRRAVESSSFADPEFKALCYAGLGNISYINCHYNAAEANWNLALENTGYSNKLNRVALLCSLANARKKIGDFTGSMDILKQAEQELENTADISVRAAFFSTRGDISLKAGDSNTAKESFHRALELSRITRNPRRTSYCLESLAKIICEDSPEKALALAEEALEFAEETGLDSRRDSSRIVLETIRKRVNSR